MDQETNLNQLQSDLGYRFQDLTLLEEALTHSSYANELGQPLKNNERLEFLGDAVLELCVSSELYKSFITAREGHLTSLRAKLVSASALARTARRLKLDQHILLGRGEESQGGRERSSVLSDCFEALVGAIYLDGGYEAARKSILDILSPVWPQHIAPHSPRDYKSRLQEQTQKLYQDRPRYVLADSAGPEHDKSYRIEVCLPDDSIFSASASSIKKAEQKAAKLALDHLSAST